MARCNFCDGGCVCHLNPPCSFCTEHVECEICGQLVCEGKAETLTNPDDGNKITVCPTCADEVAHEK